MEIQVLIRLDVICSIIFRRDRVIQIMFTRCLPYRSFASRGLAFCGYSQSYFASRPRDLGVEPSCGEEQVGLRYDLLLEEQAKLKVGL